MFDDNELCLYHLLLSVALFCSMVDHCIQEFFSSCLQRTDTDKDSVSTEGISAASGLFNVIVDCHLKGITSFSGY